MAVSSIGDAWWKRTTMGYQTIMQVLQALEKLEHHVLRFSFTQTRIFMTDYVGEKIASGTEFEEYVTENKVAV